MIDSTGNEIFTGEFNSLGEYKNGLAYYRRGAVYNGMEMVKPGERGFLDENGEVAFQYEGWNTFSDGLVRFQDSVNFYYLNSEGEIELNLQTLPLPDGKEISDTFYFSDGLAMIRIKDEGFDDTEYFGCV